MKHRLFQVIATGEWAAAALSDDHFPEDDYVDRIAVSLGLKPGTMQAVDIEDGAPDPRTGKLLEALPDDEAEVVVEAVPLFRTVLQGSEARVSDGG